LREVTPLQEWPALARVNVAFVDEVGLQGSACALPADRSAQACVGQDGFQFGQKVLNEMAAFKTNG